MLGEACSPDIGRRRTLSGPALKLIGPLSLSRRLCLPRARRWRPLGGFCRFAAPQKRQLATCSPFVISCRLDVEAEANGPHQWSAYYHMAGGGTSRVFVDCLMVRLAISHLFGDIRYKPSSGCCVCLCRCLGNALETMRKKEGSKTWGTSFCLVSVVHLREPYLH